LVCGFLFSFSFRKDRDKLPPSPGLLFKEYFGSERLKFFDYLSRPVAIHKSLGV
jgi:hypothetical protein